MDTNVELYILDGNSTLFSGGLRYYDNMTIDILDCSVDENDLRYLKRKNVRMS